MMMVTPKHMVHLKVDICVLICNYIIVQHTYILLADGLVYLGIEHIVFPFICMYMKYSFGRIFHVPHCNFLKFLLKLYVFEQKALTV